MLPEQAWSQNYTPKIYFWEQEHSLNEPYAKPSISKVSNIFLISYKKSNMHFMIVKKWHSLNTILLVNFEINPLQDIMRGLFP